MKLTHSQNRFASPHNSKDGVLLYSATPKRREAENRIAARANHYVAKAIDPKIVAKTKLTCTITLPDASPSAPAYTESI